MTQRAIAQFNETAVGFSYEIILVDNGSIEKIDLARFNDQEIKFIHNTENVGFACAVNQGIAAGSGDYVLLLNSDALVEGRAIKVMLEYLNNNKQAGIIGPRFIYPDGKNQVSSGKFPNFWREFIRLSMLHRFITYSAYNKDFDNIKSLDWVSGGCMLIKRQVIEQIGKFDENYFFSAEDMDFCLRANKRGWQVVYHPLVKVVHYLNYSSGGRKSTKAVRLERNGFD